MNSKTITFIILCSLVFGAIGSVIYNRVIIPELASVPFLIRHNIAPAPGPLVINTTQQVRVDDGTDTIAAIQRVSPWTVTVLGKDNNGNVTAIGSGILLTSDGLIATTKTVTAGQQQLWVSTQDGTTVAATLMASDPASDLVLIQAALSNQPTASFDDPSTMQLGEKVIVLSQSYGSEGQQVHVSYLAAGLNDRPSGTVFSSDQIYSTFGIGSAVDAIASVPNQIAEGGLVAGENGTVEGMYAKSGIITSGTIQSALNSYFHDQGRIVRPSIGLYYENIPSEISAISGEHQGIRVTRPDAKTPAVVSGSPAAQAGIQEGDDIYKVNGTSIDPTHSFESLVSAAQPNDVLTFELIRSGTDMVVTVIVK